MSPAKQASPAAIAPRSNVMPADCQGDCLLTLPLMKPIAKNVAAVSAELTQNNTAFGAFKFAITSIKYGNTGTLPTTTKAKNVTAPIIFGDERFWLSRTDSSCSALAAKYALEPIENPSAIKLAIPNIRMTELDIPAPAEAATTANVVTVPSTAP